MAIRVVIVDSHRFVRLGLASFLDVFDDLELAGVAEDGITALALCAERKPDVVITELTLPHLDGITLTRRLTQNYPGMKVIALDIHREPGMIEAILQAGASVYLTKETDIDDLAQAIRDVAKESRLPPMFAQTG